MTISTWGESGRPHSLHVLSQAREHTHTKNGWNCDAKATGSAGEQVQIGGRLSDGQSKKRQQGPQH
eukprot:7075278-Prorocentrum_lima.AAC.1